MNLSQPSRLAFWRFLFVVSFALPFLSIWQTIALAHTLEIDIIARKSWMGLIIVLFGLGFIPLLAWTLTWSRQNDRVLALAESPEHSLQKIHWISWLLLPLSIVGYTVTFMNPFIRDLFGGEGWIRFFIFWIFSITGMFAFRSVWQDIPRLTSLLTIILVQTCFHLLAAQFSHVTNYPFAMGWSETSRYYYPSLFLSRLIYEQKFPWPILHPTLHLLLAPPYLVNAPLWVHRLWQVLLRLILVGAIVPAMLKRLSVEEKSARWLVGMGMFLYLFMGPIYFHLAVPVIILLYGFSHQDDRKTWLVVLVASVWSGWSRVNWYPVPGMIAAVLYLMEVPLAGRDVWKYLLKPALWFVAGTLIAFVSQRVYIVLSGIPPEYFYTSLSSNLLWYRLFPNSSYFLGILPAALLASVPLWLVIYRTLHDFKDGWHPARLIFIFAALLVLFIGGLIVSLKIGGGVDLHNMDAYFVLLLLVIGYLIFSRYQREDGTFEEPVSLHWSMTLLLLIMPVWAQLGESVGIKTYDVNRTPRVLSVLQARVDQVNVEGKDILFITQRQLISMDMLHGVILIPDYEREDLMEMAMAGNDVYLARFRSDMESQRFALIVVDPLNYSIYSKRRSFSEENNVWVREVIRPLLCNYQLKESFPEDSIALYVPQEGERQCP